MKTLVIGIFLIIVVGVLFFTIQFVKNPNFQTSVAPSSNTNNATKTFIATKQGFSFTYPDGWVLHNPALVPGYAPVLRADSANNDSGFVGISIKKLLPLANVNVDVETYTDELPIQDAIEDIVGAPVSLEADQVKKLTYRSGATGFILSYSGSTDGENPIYANGRVYMYYVRNELMYAFSSYISTTPASNSATDPSKIFIDKADSALQSLITY